MVRHRTLIGFIFLTTIAVSFLLHVFFGPVFITAIYVHLYISLISGLMYLLLGGYADLRAAYGQLSNSSNLKLQRILVSVLAVGCFFTLFYILSTRLFFQIDLTEEGVNTLSNQSVEVLSRIDKPVVARYFARGASGNKADIELLRRYSAYSINFSFVEHDLDKDRPLADALGVKELNSVYLGFEDEKISKESQTARGLLEAGGLTEEKITNALLRLVRVIKPIAYFSKGHGEGSILEETDAGFSFLKEAFISDGFIVQELDYELLPTISPDKSLVVYLSCPKDLLPREQEFLQQYLKKGGSLLALLEPRQESNLLGVLSGYGFILGKDTIVGEERYTNGGASLGVQPIISHFSDHPALKDFSKSIVVSAAMSIRKKADADQVTEIAYTDENTWAETNLTSLYSKTPEAKKDQSDILGPVSVSAVFDAARVDPQGSYKEYFGKNRIAIIGDLDFAANVNLFQLFNRDYVLNVANWLVGEAEYVSIRAGTIRKSKKIISEEEYSKIFLFAGLFLPEVILIFGFYLYKKKNTLV